ncbi:MAG: YcxB family protein [Bacteroidetes bacterium]|nr:YcxB family protein [Bacteroidota bacterium]
MTIHFGYDKKKVIQALRYHFISRPEIRIMIIVVNVFALISIILYALGKITPMAFFVGSFLWVVLMISFMFILPNVVYRRAVTFKHEFSMEFTDEHFTLSHGGGGAKTWAWPAVKTFLESPHFFHLYFDPRSFFLVPKEGCKDDDEVFELRQLIKRNVGKK